MMDEKEEVLKDAVLVQLMYLNAKVHGLVAGLLTGFLIFLATNWLLLKGGDVVGPHMALLGQFFIGYRVSLVGSLIGFAYGFVVAYIASYAAARLYNATARHRETAGAGMRSGEARRAVAATRGEPRGGA